MRIIDFEQARSLLPEVLQQVGAPMGDSSILPTFLLSRFSREKVVVALSGDGGDELFAGYDPFKALRLTELYRKLVPKPVHTALRLLAAKMPMSDRNMSLDFKLNRTLRGASYQPALWNPVWLGALAPDEIGQLFREPIDAETLYSEAIELWDGSQADNLVDRTLEFYTRLYLQDNILAKTDSASMMVSLEVRAPFLDRDLVDFARRVPHTYKFRHGETKYLLKKALAPLLPRDILRRRKKGFGVPLSRWLRELPAASRPTDLPFMDPDWLAERWKDHCAHKTDYRHCLWNCLALDQTLRAPDAPAPAGVWKNAG